MSTTPAPGLRLQPATFIRRKDARHLTNPVGDESVLLDLHTGDYLGMNRVAAEIWRLLEQPIRLEELERRLMESFEVEPDRCRADTHLFLDRMAMLGLLEVPPTEG